MREIKEVTDEKIAQILDQARSMGYLHIDMAWEIGVLDPLVWLVYILHLNCLIHKSLYKAFSRTTRLMNCWGSHVVALST